MSDAADPPKTITGLSARPAGFTLIEILVALFIFSLVSLLMSSALHSLMRSHSAVEKSAEHLAELQVALLLLSRDIEQTLNRPSGGNAAFSGTEHTFTCTHTGLANPLGQLRRSTLQRTRYTFAHGQLIRMTWPQVDSPATVPPDSRILLGDVRQLSFSYLDDKERFHKAWPLDTPKKIPLPRAVRIILTLPGTGRISQLYRITGESLENAK